jgi:endonuclease YncB( thermonuclease family)
MGESRQKTSLRRLVASALIGVALLSFSNSGPWAGVRPPGALAGSAEVIDGDTIDVGGQRVRLEGIDAPETAQTCGGRWMGSWKCGLAASQALSRLIGDANVTCARHGGDKYGRIIAVCSVGGEELNAAMVRLGMAWAFIKYSTRYVELEAAAKASKAGVWQGDAEAPWIYREHRWQAAGQTAPGGCAIKGNVTGNGQIYHTPWSPWYSKVRVDAAKGERWFCSEAEAQKAGWRAVY